MLGKEEWQRGGVGERANGRMLAGVRVSSVRPFIRSSTLKDMYFTPERLLMIAVVMTLISVDGARRAWQQHEDGTISGRLFVGYVTALSAGSSMTWISYLLTWT